MRGRRGKVRAVCSLFECALAGPPVGDFHAGGEADGVECGGGDALPPGAFGEGGGGGCACEVALREGCGGGGDEWVFGADGNGGDGKRDGRDRSWSEGRRRGWE